MMFTCFSSLILFTIAIVHGLPSISDFNNLESTLCGEIVLKDTNETEYIDGNKLDNGYFADILSLAIIYCECEDDVVNAINFINLQQSIDDTLEFSVRSGGHSYSGYSKCQDCIIVDTSRLNTISYDSNQKTITAGPGVLCRDLITFLSDNNVIIPNPASPTVSLGGYTIGGGVPLLVRSIGLMADYLVSAKIVLANGDLVEVTDNDSDSDSSSSDESDESISGNVKKILYALRGGGLSIGIVTEYTYSSIPLVTNNIYIGTYTARINIPITFANGGTDAKTLLKAYRDITFDDNPLNNPFYDNDAWNPSFSFGFDFASFNYRVSVTIAYVGTEYDTYGPDYIENVFLPLLNSKINFTVTIDEEFYENYFDYVTEAVATTEFFSGFGAGYMIPSRLLINAQNVMTNDFVNNLVDFHLYIGFNLFVEDGLLITTISQNWMNGKFTNFDKESKITSFPNRDANGNIEIIFTGLKETYDTEESVINELKPILDIYGGIADNLLSVLGDQVYLNYVSLFQTSYLNYFGRNDEYENNEKIIKRIQKLKEKYDENDMFSYQTSIPF